MFRRRWGPPGHGVALRNCEPDPFNYTKNDVGFDVWWRFARGQRVGFGYWNLDQTRVDYDKAHANTVFVEYKNTMFDTLSGRIKYRYIKRDSTLNYSNAGVSPGDPNFLLPFTSAFDMKDLTINEVKHHAYRERTQFDVGYRVFMTGPSATADIEGALIHGAQGIRTLTVVALPRQ